MTTCAVMSIDGNYVADHYCPANKTRAFVDEDFGVDVTAKLHPDNSITINGVALDKFVLDDVSYSRSAELRGKRVTWSADKDGNWSCTHTFGQYLPEGLCQEVSATH